MSTRPIEGDLWQPSASEARRYARVVDAYERAAHRLGVPATAPPSGPGVVQVLNETGGDVPRFGVLGISSVPLVDPTHDEDRFCSRALLRGVKPVFPEHDNHFAIAMHPARANELLYCVIAGITIARLAGADEEDPEDAQWYRFADICDGEGSTEQLQRLPYGSAQILTSIGIDRTTWGIVRLGVPGGLHKITAVLREDLEHDDTALIWRTRKTGSGNYDDVYYSLEVHPPQWFTGMIPSGTHITAWWDPFSRHWYVDGGPCQM